MMWNATPKNFGTQTFDQMYSVYSPHFLILTGKNAQKTTSNQDLEWNQNCSIFVKKETRWPEIDVDERITVNRNAFRKGGALLTQTFAAHHVQYFTAFFPLSRGRRHKSKFFNRRCSTVIFTQNRKQTQNGSSARKATVSNWENKQKKRSERKT